VADVAEHDNKIHKLLITFVKSFYVLVKGQSYETFYERNLQIFVARVFVPVKPFRPSLMFVGKARGQP
jgi:hypothetical protein